MYDGLSEDILGNYAGYLAQAKLHEAEGKTIPSLQQQVADLETDKAALTEKVTSLEGQVTDKMCIRDRSWSTSTAASRS